MKDKNCIIFLIAFSYVIIQISDACAATSSVSSPTLITTTSAATTTSTTTTTTTPVTTSSTTTTTTTTTTAAPAACQACTAADITLDPSMGITPMASPVTVVGGCNAISVTCTAPAAMNVFMDFDNGMNNPDDNQMNPVVAMFTCNAMGMWEYTSNIAMQSYVISTISCFAF